MLIIIKIENPENKLPLQDWGRLVDAVKTIASPYCKEAHFFGEGAPVSDKPYLNYCLIFETDDANPNANVSYLLDELENVVGTFNHCRLYFTRTTAEFSLIS